MLCITNSVTSDNLEIFSSSKSTSSRSCNLIHFYSHITIHSKSCGFAVTNKVDRDIKLERKKSIIVSSFL